MTAENTTPESRENVAESTEAENKRREMAMQQVVSPQVEVVADQVRDAWRESEGPAEAAERLRQAEANVGLVADLLESVSEK